MRYRKAESQQIIGMRCEEKKLHFRLELAEHNLKDDYLNDFESKKVLAPLILHSFLVFFMLKRKAFVGCFNGLRCHPEFFFFFFFFVCLLIRMNVFNQEYCINFMRIFSRSDKLTTFRGWYGQILLLNSILSILG